MRSCGALRQLRYRDRARAELEEVLVHVHVRQAKDFAAPARSNRYIAVRGAGAGASPTDGSASALRFQKPRAAAEPIGRCDVGRSLRRRGGNTMQLRALRGGAVIRQHRDGRMVMIEADQDLPPHQRRPAARRGSQRPIRLEHAETQVPRRVFVRVDRAHARGAPLTPAQRERADPASTLRSPSRRGRRWRTNRRRCPARRRHH